MLINVHYSVHLQCVLSKHLLGVKVSAEQQTYSKHTIGLQAYSLVKKIHNKPVILFFKNDLDYDHGNDRE